ncbi:PIN domain-like protein [Aulographum hederae CBS 113979]|uniref:PIN domain-like protein n=1 Tax=Aulographum hederae CBS 113979 TaxID=1176131 RepID=A0A6G1GKJ3_9PEZI|nr:PIN domain-like protein [Aulographum hederae CBS 113979]
MGIKTFWPVLDQQCVGEAISIPVWANSHYRKHGRSLRIAVDEANWRFNSISDAEVDKIRQKCPPANPREKRTLERERALSLLGLNVQLVFVFDGPNKPSKNSRNGRKVDESRVSFLKLTLDNLGIPYHTAPGEAEAECAKLQQLGVVDAVWTDDSDAFMFGAKTIIRFHRDQKGNKSLDKAMRYSAERIESHAGLDRSKITMFAFLVGCDYGTSKGLPECGEILALQLTRQQALPADNVSTAKG